MRSQGALEARGWSSTILLGARRGLRAYGSLIAIIAPIYTVMAVLKYAGLLQTLARWCRPGMRHFGLPGDAALALVVGNFLNLYSAIGVIASLRLSSGQLTLLSLMLLLSHSQILETSVFYQIRAKYNVIWVVRLLTALLLGHALHYVICPNADVSSVGVLAAPKATALSAAFLEYARGLLDLSVKTLVVMVGIFVGLEVFARLRLLVRALAGLNRFTRFLGFSTEAGLPLVAGVVFGIVFGAGVITDSVREQKLDRRQVLLVSIFLALCHGLIEDTGLMAVLGANVFWITVPRLVLATLVVWLVGRLYRPCLD